MITIFVSNLPYAVTELELRILFDGFGDLVRRPRIVCDRETGKSKGFAFVEMKEREDGTAAIEALNGGEWGGRTLKVREADNRPSKSSLSEAVAR